MSNTTTYRGCTASMTYDPDDRIIVGRVNDVDDIITFHGHTIIEFEANFHRIVDDYIAACQTFGGLPEAPGSGKLALP